MSNRINPPLDVLASLPLDDESRTYIRYHAPRYRFLFDLIGQFDQSQIKTILDIGPAYQTVLLQTALPDSIIDTLGFADPRFPVLPRAVHHEFDLNLSQFPDRVPSTGPYDLILMGEVIEHLSTAPELILGAIWRWTKPGGRLIIQTPNAVALPKRLKLFVGIHPFEQIRTTPQNPGHFREYTPQELVRLATRIGWTVEKLTVRNYFAGTSLANRLYNAMSIFLPPTLRSGISLVLERPVKSAHLQRIHDQTTNDTVPAHAKVRERVKGGRAAADGR